MKKKIKQGFTLAEALIAIAIIGVVSAILLPLSSKFMPDKNKVLYLKTYDSIIDITHDIASNTAIYPILNQNDQIIYKNYPLYNTVLKTFGGKNYGGNNAKFCQLLAVSFNEENAQCSSGYTASPTWKKSDISFSAQNGVEFFVYTTKSLTGSQINYESDIYFDVDGVENGKNCMYNASTCKQPDRFKLMVSSDGKVVAADLKGQTYLAKRSNYRLNKDEDATGIYLAKLETKDYSKALEMLQNNQTEEEPAGGGDEGGGKEEIVLPPGQKFVDGINPANLRTTNAKGVYCEQHNPNMPAGNYTHQRHYYWHAEAGSWVELEGVYAVSSGQYNFEQYTGEGAGSVMVWNSWHTAQ